MKTQTSTTNNKEVLASFVESFKKPRTFPTVGNCFGIQSNHEAWRKCTNCGAYNDRRKTNYCEDCGTKL